ncbi:TPA: cytochrome P450 monooxygenase 59 [Trebouxia sp. C0005]
MADEAGGGKETNASQFYITTGLELDSLDGKHTIFGEVSEGLDVLQQIDEAFVDDAGWPVQNIRIRHTHVLDDPFDDPPELATLIPEASPPPTFEQGDRLEDDWKPTEDTRAPEVIEEEIRRSEAQNRAVVLEMIGDLPEADSKPPTNMLFIAKLNQVTTEEDLETIFGRFGNITSCDIIKDKKTGDSLCYAFLGYDNDTSCEDAYEKMNNVLIDDRRIKVDFSQSVYHLWKQFRRFGKDSGAPDPSQQGPNALSGAIGGHDRLQLKSTGRGYQRGSALTQQESPFKQGPAGISPQGVRRNHFSSPVTSAAGMTRAVEVQTPIWTDMKTDIRTTDTEVAAVSTVTHIMKEMNGATDLVKELGKTAGHIESTGILPIQVATKDSLATDLKRMITEAIGVTGQAMDIEIRLAGMCMTDTTGVIKAAARMLMSGIDTNFSWPNFSFKCLMLDTASE